MTTIIIPLGDSQSDQIQITVEKVTDLLEVRDAVLAQKHSYALAVAAALLVYKGKFKILKG